MPGTQRQQRVRHWAAIGGAAVFIGVIVWVDVTSALWQEVVILSGLAAGLVMFLLTALVLDRVVERSTARRWAPVNRLAFSAFLHAVADDEKSEISRGEIVARSLPQVRSSPDDGDYLAELHSLREIVVEEREILTDALARWAQFLASSGDNEVILTHVAEIALCLDRIRDRTLDAEEAKDHASHTALNAGIREANERFTMLIDELKSRVTDTHRRRAAPTSQEATR